MKLLLEAISLQKTLLRPKLSQKQILRSLVAGLVTTSSLLTQCIFATPVQAQLGDFNCRFSAQEVSEKEKLRQAWVEGDPDAETSYKALIQQHGELLENCRSQNWPETQAIWLRLYPCDANPGVLDKILDQIANLGYNQVYVEAFGNSQVLLPPSDNPTPWISVVRDSGQENVDLLAQAIEKGHKRGMKVYAWMFAMNFGYAYAQRQDRQQLLALNGRGETSLSFKQNSAEAFIDPYNRQAQIDYSKLIRAVAKRRPDGILFDYIRYPRGSGSQSVAGNVKDLWIYGDASRSTLLQRAINQKGRLLIERFLSRGHLIPTDFNDMERLYPQEGPPLWQGRNPSAEEKRQLELPSNEEQESEQANDGVKAEVSLYENQRLQNKIQKELWTLSVAHAAQGVIDFLNSATRIVQSEGIPAGAVFFPDGNRGIGTQGYDSRLQPWNNFPDSIEWHPMAYAVCGEANCIVEQVEWVMSMKPENTSVMPVLAGVWGKPHSNRPSLEIQMEALRQQFPEVAAVSHFAFSWQEPQFTAVRKRCQVQ